MDSESIYALVGLVIFVTVGVIILRSDESKSSNKKEVTKNKIINAYKKELYEALLPLKNDKEARVAKKSELLKRFSAELTSNIFFDEIESREIILDLVND